MGGRSVDIAAADTTTVTARCSGSLASFRGMRSRCSGGETAMATEDRPAVASRTVRTGRSCTPSPLYGRRVISARARQGQGNGTEIVTRRAGHSTLSRVITDECRAARRLRQREGRVIGGVRTSKYWQAACTAQRAGVLSPAVTVRRTRSEAARRWSRGDDPEPAERLRSCSDRLSG